MKKINFTIILSIIFFTSLSVSVAKTFSSGSSKPEIIMNVLIFDEQTKESQTIMDAIEKYWTCTKYKFLNYEEFKLKATSVGINEYFLLPTNLFGFTKFDVIKGGTGIKIKEKLGIPTISYNSESVIYNVSISYLNLHPQFSIAQMNSRFENDIVYNRNKRKSLWVKGATQGITFYRNTTLDSIKGKTLLIDIGTANGFNTNGITNNGYGLYYFLKNESKLKSCFSKVLGIPETDIFILESEDICNSFETGKKDFLYICPKIVPFSCYIMDYQGKYIAFLNKFRKLKKVK